MKTVAKVKLLPDADAYRALEDTLALCNEVACNVAETAQDREIFSRHDLQPVTYGAAKAAGLSAQPALHTIRKVADAYKARKANAKAGNYGDKDSDRYQRIMSEPISFRKDAAQPYDDRCLSWNHQAHTVSIWTTEGRIKNIPFLGKRKHMREIAAHRKGETDLVRENGIFYLIATIDHPDTEPDTPDGFIGVDLGVANLAVDSDGNTHGADNHLRDLRQARINERRALQQKGTKSAKRKLKKKSGRESRRMTDTNHRIAKQIVAKAKRTGKGIALEDLTGIRSRVRHRKSQRATFHSWAFAQLGQFIAYKAALAGVPVVFVDPAYTSQTCSACGHPDKKNRTTQDQFTCTRCGVMMHADHNAAVNIAALGAEQYKREVALALVA